MMATTEFSSNFFSTYMTSDSLTSLATAPLGDFAGDFDVDRLESLILDRINGVTSEFGVTVYPNGIAYCEYGADIDTEGLREALEGALNIEEMTAIQQQCEISR